MQRLSEPANTTLHQACTHRPIQWLPSCYMQIFFSSTICRDQNSESASKEQDSGVTCKKVVQQLVFQSKCSQSWIRQLQALCLIVTVFAIPSGYHWRQEGWGGGGGWEEHCRPAGRPAGICWCHHAEQDWSGVQAAPQKLGGFFASHESWSKAHLYLWIEGLLRAFILRLLAPSVMTLFQIATEDATVQGI